MRSLVQFISALLFLLGPSPAFGQETQLTPLQQLLIWEHTPEEEILATLGESYRPIINRWEACLSEGECNNLPTDKIQAMLEASIQQQLYDSIRVAEQYLDLEQWLSLDTLTIYAPTLVTDSVTRPIPKSNPISQIRELPLSSQPQPPAPLWLKVADDLLVNAIEEEAIETAVQMISAELQKLKETDTLIHILFPTVSHQIQNYSERMPAALALQHFKAALIMDYQQLDARFPFALQQMGRLDSQSVQIIEEGEYWLDRYWQGHIEPPVFAGDAPGNPSFPVNNWLTFLNSAFNVTADQPLHPIAIRQLRERGRLTQLCHWWAGLNATATTFSPDLLGDLPYKYAQGMISYHHFIRNARIQTGTSGRADLLRDYIKTFLGLRGCFLSAEDALASEQILNAIADLRYNSKSKPAQHKALMGIAESLALDNHPLILLLGNLALQDDLDDFQQTLKEIYLPHASFSSLRKNKRTYLLMGYAGLHSGLETSLHPERSLKGIHTAMGICAGPALSIGTGKYAHTFLLQFIDLGAPFSFLIKDAENIRSGQFPETFNPEAIFSPGAGYFLGLSNTPLSLGLSAAIINNGRTDPNGLETDILRFNLGLYLDFPIYTLAQARHSFTH
jgi:hypothetical protein